MRVLCLRVLCRRHLQRAVSLSTSLDPGPWTMDPGPWTPAKSRFAQYIEDRSAAFIDVPSITSNHL